MLGLIFKRIKFVALYFGRLYLFVFSIFFVFGVVFPNLSEVAGYLLLLFVVPFLFTRKKGFLILAICTICFLAGAIRFNNFQKRYEESYLKSLLGQEVNMEGVIMSEGIRKGAVTEYLVKLNSEENNNYGHLLIKLPRYPEYAYADKVMIYGVVKEPEEFEDFSYKEFLKTQNIYALIKNPGIKKVGEEGNFIFKEIYEFKRVLTSHAKSALGEPHGSLLLGILLGIKSGMLKDFSESLSNTSTTHIVAASGYNVTIVLASLAPLQFVIGRRRLFYFSLMLLGLFAILVGLDNVPALRAAVMGYIYLFAKYVGRKGHILTLLTFTAALFIFINPFVYRSLSFQLSFVSTYGLLILSDRVENTIKFFPSIIRKELSPTLAATIATTPITLANFGKVSTVSLLVNVLVLPTVPMIMFLGAISSFLMLLNRQLGTIFSFIVYFPLEYMIEVISFFGDLDFASKGINWNPNLSIFVYLIILILFVESSFRNYMKRYEN